MESLADTGCLRIAYLGIGRMKLPESLRREVFLIEPAEDISGCKKIQEEITEELEYQPGELYVMRYCRHKYAKPDGEGVVIAQ